MLRGREGILVADGIGAGDVTGRTARGKCVGIEPAVIGVISRVEVLQTVADVDVHLTQAGVEQAVVGGERGFDEDVQPRVHAPLYVGGHIGDAVMAVWGAPVSAGNSAADALNCVRAALMMRHSLMEFNVGRGSERKPIIRIGCGINTGAVVAGQIGSEKRMEYTVIGDTVNFASRTESLNKPLGTDILITENTYLLIKDKVLVEEMPSVTVKGKEKPVRIYAVINMPEASDIPGAGPEGPQTLSQVRQLLGIPEPDLRGVNLDAEEKKYTIQN